MRKYPYVGSGLQVARSSKSRFIGEYRGGRLYSHTIRWLAGKYVLVLNDQEFETYESIDEIELIFVKTPVRQFSRGEQIIG